MGSAFRLARLVAVVVSIGFSYGGFIGIFRSGDPADLKALGCVLLVALLLLHLYNCVRTSDGRRPAAWQWTLLLQVVLTAAGMYLFPSTWYGNTGFLAAAFLLLMRPVWLAWAAFAVMMLAQYLSGLEVRPTVWDAAYLALGHTAFVGIALYGLARFADLVGDLEKTRTELAEAEVARERLAFAQQLNERVGTILGEVIRRGEEVRRSADVPAVREGLVANLVTARSALRETRSVAHGLAGEVPPPPRRRGADDLTTAFVTGLGVAAASLMLLATPSRVILKSGEPAGRIALYYACLAVFTALFLWCCWTGDDDGRPRHWRPALVAAFVMAFLPGLAFERELWWVSLFLPALTLILLRGWQRWALTGALVVQDAVTLQIWDVTLQGATVVDQIYGVVWTAERALIVYGFARMGQIARELRAARAELARTEVAGERLRFARDLHDLLGFSLSVIVLKGELAVRLLGTDPTRAQDQMDEGLAAARRALADIETVAAGYRELTLEDEVASTRTVLEAAGFTVGGTVAIPRITPEQSNVLAIVLREGVTNILRHGAGRHATLDVTSDADAVRLRLRNEGIRPAGAPPGAGLDNLAYRVGAAGGRLTGEAGADFYVLSAEIPLDPALVGDVPAVAGAA